MTPKELRENRHEARTIRYRDKRIRKRLAVIHVLKYICPICTDTVLEPGQWDLSDGFPRCKGCTQNAITEGGYRQKRVAELMGVSHSYLSKMLSGKRKAVKMRKLYFEVIHELARGQTERVQKAREIYLRVFGE